MSGDFPDDWFRPERPAHPVPGGVDPAGAAGEPAPTEAMPAAAPAGDERYTDQFKPDYPLTERPARPTTARPRAEGAEPAPDAEPGTAAGATSSASHSVGVAPSTSVDALDAGPTRERRRGVVPAALGLAALTAVGVAASQVLTRHDSTTNTTDPQLSNAPAAASTDTGSAAPSPWTGAVQVVKASKVVASCTAPTKTGYDGQRVSSAASRVLDGDLSTGWRCDGDADGQTLTFTFPKGTTVVGVRMTNGYPKTVSGAELYPQYRRVTTVTWSFPALDNAFFLQNLADDHPALQEIRIPQTSAAGGMQLQVTTSTTPGSSDASRNAVVLTEVQFLTRKA